MAVFRRDPQPKRRGAIRITPPASPLQQGVSFYRAPQPVNYAGEHAVSAPFNTGRGLTAAASKLELTRADEVELFKKRRTSGQTAWQSEAYEYYDAIGEINYAFNLLAAVTSRVRLYIGVVDDATQTPTPVEMSSTVDQKTGDAAIRTLGRLNTAFGGQSGLLRDAALNLSIVGECYLVNVPPNSTTGAGETWDIRSTDEIEIDSKNRARIIPRRDLRGKTGPGTILLPNDPYIGRIWNPHPRFSDEADSSMRGVLDLCSELLLLNRAFRGMEKSRLNAGMLYIPDGISVAAEPDPDMPYDAEGEASSITAEEAADDFEEQLLAGMSEPIADESAANSVVPIIIRGPADLGKAIRQLEFERKFDKTMESRSATVLDRIMTGLNVPKDIAASLTNVRYSNAKNIDDNFYKAHIEPLMVLICDALTQIYLRPALEQSKYADSDIQRIVIWYDPSAISTRTDKAADAENLFEKHALSLSALRRAHGFSDDDAPTPNEYALRILTDNAMLSPELTETLLQTFSPDVMNAAKATQQASSVAPIPGDVANAIGVPPTAAGANPPPLPPDRYAPAPTGAPADPNAPPIAPIDTATPADNASPTPVQPGEDAPPIPLDGAAPQDVASASAPTDVPTDVPTDTTTEDTGA